MIAQPFGPRRLSFSAASATTCPPSTATSSDPLTHSGSAFTRDDASWNFTKPPRYRLTTDASTSSRVNSPDDSRRSEEHTSELQSRQYLVCRLLLEKKKK